ncbi:Fluoroquinolones export ATP-binding protein [compost metagenome]
MILTTHDMDEADRLSDMVAIMDRGKILMMDSPEGIKRAFGAGDVLQVRVNGLSMDEMHRLLNSFPPVFTERTISDGLLLLGAKDVIASIPLVHRTLKEFHVQAEDLTIRKRTLEDAFISMTGRGLRE